MSRSGVIGTILVVIGLYAFVDDLLGLPSIDRFWPLVLLTTGLYFLYSFHVDSSRKSRILTGSFLSLCGLYLLLFTIGPVAWDSFRGMLPLFLSFLGVSVWLYGYAHDHVRLRRLAWIILAGSILLLLSTMGAVPINFWFGSKLLVPFLMLIAGVLLFTHSRGGSGVEHIPLTQRQRKRTGKAWGVFLAGTGIIILAGLLFDIDPGLLIAGVILVFGGIILLGLVFARCVDGLGIAWGFLLSGVFFILLGVDLAGDIDLDSVPLVLIIAGCWLLSRRNRVTRS